MFWTHCANSNGPMTRKAVPYLAFRRGSVGEIRIALKSDVDSSKKPRQ